MYPGLLLNILIVGLLAIAAVAPSPNQAAEDPADTVADGTVVPKPAKPNTHRVLPHDALVRPAASPQHEVLNQAWVAHDTAASASTSKLLAAIDSLRVDARASGNFDEALRLRNLAEAVTKQGDIPSDGQFSSERREITDRCHEAGSRLIQAYRELVENLTRDLNADEKLAKAIDDERLLLEEKLAAAIAASAADRPGRSAGLTRPTTSLKHPQLDAAWSTYRDAVGVVITDLDRRLSDLHAQARKAGRLKEALALTELREKIGSDGVPPCSPSTPADIESAQKNLQNAENDLLEDYDILIDSLTKDVNVPEDIVLRLRKERDDISKLASAVAVAATNSIGMNFISLPPASKVDGRGKSNDVASTPPFYLGQHEVTNSQWKAVMGGKSPSKWKEDEQPVCSVSWNDATEFCRALSSRPEEQKAGRRYRLPTVAEWQYAARADTTTRWPCGDNDASLIDFAWFKNNNSGQPRQVGTRKPNPWGLHDMLGNLYEWCADNRVKGKALAGGSFDSPSEYASPDHLTWGSATDRKIHIGFRVVLIRNATEHGPGNSAPSP